VTQAITPDRYERIYGEAQRFRASSRPAGYVGYEEGGALDRAIRRRPYQVGFSRRESKSHPDVSTCFLKYSTDGSLTDGQGRTVDFRNR